MISKFLGGHHKLEQIIGDVESTVMKRKILKGDSCLICEFEPKLVKDSLDNEDLIQVTNKEIEKIEKKNT